MTTLLSRPSPPSAPSRSPAAVPARPLGPVALVAGLGVAAGGLLVFWAIALTGWFLADGGSHGDTKDALRVGADAWLVGHGAHLTYAGVTYGVTPLGLTLLLAWAAHRAGRWAGQRAPTSLATAGGSGEAITGVALFASGYLVVAVVTAVLAGTPQASVGLVRALFGSLLMAGIAGGSGLLLGSGQARVLVERVPTWLRAVVRAAAATVVGTLACGAVLTVVSFALHVGAAASLISRLALAPGDAVMLCLVSALLAPNAALLGVSYLLGPGFAVGTGTTVSPAVVALGPMPAFPLLAALPGDGPTPAWAVGLSVLPGVVAALAVALVHRRHPVRAWDLALFRGVGAGVLAGFATGLLCGLAGGALGDGRMADVGAASAAVAVAGALAMGVGGLFGAAAGLVLQRRTDRRAGADADPDGDPDAEPTVVAGQLPRRVLVGSRPDEITVALDRHGVRVQTPEPDDVPAEDPWTQELRDRFATQLRHTSSVVEQVGPVQPDALVVEPVETPDDGEDTVRLR